MFICPMAWDFQVRSRTEHKRPPEVSHCRLSMDISTLDGVEKIRTQTSKLKKNYNSPLVCVGWFLICWEKEGHYNRKLQDKFYPIVDSLASGPVSAISVYTQWMNELRFKENILLWEILVYFYSMMIYGVYSGENHLFHWQPYEGCRILTHLKRYGAEGLEGAY